MVNCTNMKSLYAGQYKLQVIRRGIIRHETDWFDNLITNAGLDAYGGIRSNTYRAYIGTGTSVAETDTTMPAVATTTSYTGSKTLQASSIPYWARERHVFTFTQGIYVGTISDVGIGWGTGVSSFTPLYSHALLPSPITLESIDQVILTYDHYFTFSDYTYFDFDINGITYSGKTKPVFATYNRGYQSLTFPGGHYYFSTNRCNRMYRGMVLANINQLQTIHNGFTTEYDVDDHFQNVSTYVAGSFTANVSKTYPAEFGNLTDVNGTHVVLRGDPAGYCGDSFAMSWSPAFTKTNLEKLILNFNISWGRTTVPV